MTESKSKGNQHLIYITNCIGERLSSSKLKLYINLMKLFRSGGIEADKLLKSLLAMFKEDELLSQLFNKLMDKEIRELKEKELQEQNEEAKRKRKSKSKNDDVVEEGEVQEDHPHRRLRKDADLPIKKRSKYRLEPTGPALKPHDFVSTINQDA